ncbi:hypothetical protein A6R73_11080 [Xanthomonas translucens pv. poae]|uniref:Uncharacterized protein n=1 Tax=Xanthomonas graminis pv. poae TaxID=227946 RepID=A0A199P864_9XANT|nr:hypothetical protein A6R73_11080 [Xanthomonas translucens pv. poae]
MLGELGELSGFPAGAAFGEDALQKLGASLLWFAALRARSTPVGGEGAFHGPLQQRLAVLHKLTLRCLQLSHACIKVG